MQVAGGPREGSELVPRGKATAQGSFADYMLFQWDRIQPEGAGRNAEKGQKTQ